MRRAGRAPAHDDQVRDLVKFGVDEAAARAWVEAADPIENSECVVFPENAAAVRLFARLNLGAWRYSPETGRLLGIIPSELHAVLELSGQARDTWPDLWERLSLMQSEGLEALYAS